jgi:hypothetical protein
VYVNDALRLAQCLQTLSHAREIAEVSAAHACFHRVNERMNLSEQMAWLAFRALGHQAKQHGYAHFAEL